MYQAINGFLWRRVEYITCMKKPFHVALAFLLLAASASAVSIGAGPSTIDFGKLVRGGYAEEEVTVSTSGDEDLTCTVEFLGGLKDWLSVDVGDSFELPANSRVRLKAVVQPPLDAGNGVYEGAIYIKAGPTSSAEGGTGMVVGAGTRISVKAEITGEESVSIIVRNLRVSDTEVGYPIPFSGSVVNSGNVRVKPVFDVTVADASGSEVASKTHDELEVLPTRMEDFEFTIPSTGLKVGAYSADVKVHEGGELMYNQTLPFNMLEEGSWSVSGELKEIILNVESASPGEAVKALAVFKNTGQVKVNAKFKGEASLEGRLQGVVESDELTVTPGETVNMEFYYTPSEAGNYLLRGYVLYNGVKTDTKGVILAVGGGGDNLLYIAVAALLLLAVIAYLKFFRGGGSEYEYVREPSYE